MNIVLSQYAILLNMARIGIIMTGKSRNVEYKVIADNIDRNGEGLTSYYKNA